MRGTTLLIVASFFLPIFATPLPVDDIVDLAERAPIIEALPVELRSATTVEEPQTLSAFVQEDTYEDEIDATEDDADDESEKRAVRGGGGIHTKDVRGHDENNPKAVRPGSGTRISRAVRGGAGTRIGRAVRPGSGTRIGRAVRPGGGTRGKRSFVERAFGAVFG